MKICPPKPKDIETVVMAYEIDEGFQRKLELLKGLNPDGLLLIIGQKQKISGRHLEYRHSSDMNSCLLFMQDYGNKTARIDEIQTTLKYLAYELGILPAAFYEFLPLYNRKFRVEYRHYFVAQCKYGGRACVRPDHLIPFSYDGHPLRPTPR